MAWEITQHLLFRAIFILIKEKLIPNLICLSPGARWRAFGSMVSYLPKSGGMFVLQNNVAPTARWASMNLRRVLQ